jgi:hypothetical protein
MKTILTFIGTLILLLLLCASVFAGAKTLEFTWRQTLPDPNDLAGWRLYSSQTQGGPYSLVLTIPFVSEQTQYSSTQPFVSPDGQRKTYYFVLTAFDTSGNESGYSNEASASIDFEAPGVPIQLKVTVTTP